MRLTGPEVSIGREASNTVVFSDETVSQQHARLVFDGEGWRLVDDRSSVHPVAHRWRRHAVVLGNAQVLLGAADL